MRDDPTKAMETEGTAMARMPSQSKGEMTTGGQGGDILSETAPGLLRRRGVWIGGGLLLAILGGSAVLWSGGGAPPPPTSVSGLALPSGAEGLPVSVLLVADDRGYKSEQRHAGRLVARRESALGFDRTGRLEAVTADIGDPVAEGAVVARLDTRSLDQREAELRAGKAGALANLSELQARLDLARITADRKAALVARNTVTRQSYDDARLEAEALEASLLGARAEVDRYDAQLQSVAVDRDLSVLTVPYDAVVTARYLDEGAPIQPGQAVLDIREAGAPEARVGLPREEALTLSEGQEVTLFRGTTPLKATVRRIVETVNMETRTVPIILDLAPGEMALPGEVVQMVTDRWIDKPGIWVPLDALSESRQGLWAVYTVVPEGGEGTQSNGGVLVRREVDVLYVNADRVYVQGDLKPGEQVVAQGSQRLVPGQRVRVVKTIAFGPEGPPVGVQNASTPNSFPEEDGGSAVR
ncbi:efflux RND transporter periplasmic adaptor subunit [Rhodospirillum sp. A1_3_36]|uniref:efflux RND transporter periplasmic adaptor subunit n=1 Tax=Rhodospirillum sp. A1_3_36 TaxID=3391666 RepID=UPI0039A592FA